MSNKTNAVSLLKDYEKLFDLHGFQNLNYHTLLKHKNNKLKGVMMTDQILAMQYAYTQVNHEHGYDLAAGYPVADECLNKFMSNCVQAYSSVNNLGFAFDESEVIKATIEFFHKRILVG